MENENKDRIFVRNTADIIYVLFEDFFRRLMNVRESI